MVKRASAKRAEHDLPPGKRLYTLEVFIIGGPVTEKFAKQNPVISRTIQICGDQTLEDLHHAIFDAFDRFDDHMYEFQFGKGPMDPKAPRYVLPHPESAMKRFFFTSLAAMVSGFHCPDTSREAAK